MEPKNGSNNPASPADERSLELAAYAQIMPLDRAVPTEFSPELQKMLTELSVSTTAITPAAGKLPPQYGEQVDAFVRVVQSNIAGIITIKEEMQKRVDGINSMIRELDEKAGDEHRPFNIDEVRVRQHLTEERKRITEGFLEQIGQDRDFYYAHRAEILQGFGRQLRDGRIAQVPYVADAIEEIVLGLERGQSVFIHGDTGGGKTEVARIAAKIFSGKEPLVVRGYPGMAQEELFGHLTLQVDGMRRAADVVEKIDVEVATWKVGNPDADRNRQDKATELITQKLLSENRATVVDYVLGAEYLARRDGRVIIHDEANAMPPALRRKLNDLKTKRVGEIVNVQEDGGTEFPVAKGFGQIETANLGKRYGEGGNGRFAYSPDEEDRRQNKIEYRYLPQAVKGGYQDVSKATDKQLFMIAVAALIDSKGNMVAPRDALDKLWMISQYSALTQQAFSGTISADNHFRQGGTKVSVKTDVLISPRGLQNILGDWRSDGFSHELDYYLGKNILGRTTDPTQRAYLYQLAETCGFFKSSGWAHDPQLLAGKVDNFSVDIPKNGAAEIDVKSVIEIIEAIWGKAPARSEWRAGINNAGAVLVEEERIRMMAGMQGLLGAVTGLKVLTDDLTKGSTGSGSDGQPMKASRPKRG